VRIEFNDKFHAGSGCEGWVNAVQGLDDVWKREVEQVDVRMKESLRTKAQLSDRDVDECYQSFTHELLQRQSIYFSHSAIH